MSANKNTGHIAAFITIFIWGTTFTASKILLEVFTPFELLLFRFLIGYAALLLICPKRLKLKEKKQEWMFALAGLVGVTIHYLTENMAVSYSMASTVGILKSVSPLMIALITCLILKEEKLTLHFLAGFAIVIPGIALVSLNGGGSIGVSPAGILLALFSALMWAVYSLLIKKISSYGYGTVPVTRRIFFYGILFMLPLMKPFGFSPDMGCFLEPSVIVSILFLGLGASALTFLSWNTAVRLLGPVKTGLYIYLVPLITVFASALILHEKITWAAAAGVGLILLGLFVSENVISILRPAR